MNLEFENKIRLGQRKQQLREAGTSTKGNIDKLDTLITKAKSSIEKAQSACLDAADDMDAIMIEAVAIGGKIAQIIPSHVKTHIAKLTQIADQELGGISDSESQSSLNKLQDFIGNIPYNEIRPKSASERRDQISMQPNLSAGPQSQISENMSLEEAYKTILMQETEEVYDDQSLNFNALKESQIFGQTLDAESINSIVRSSEKIIVPKMRESLRNQVAANDDSFEEQEELQESGPLDFSKLRSFNENIELPPLFEEPKE